MVDALALALIIDILEDIRDEIATHLEPTKEFVDVFGHQKEEYDQLTPLDDFIDLLQVHLTQANEGDMEE